MRCIALAIAITLTITLAPSARAECISENAEAVTLANQGDAVVQVNVDEAIAKYEQALDAARSSSRIAGKLAAAYEKKESWAMAAEALASACKLDPTNAAYAFRLGRARLRLAKAGGGTYADAREAFLAAVRLDPNWAEAHYELANVTLELDDEKGALEELTKAVQLGPAIAAHWAALADLYRRLNRLVEASKVVGESARFTKEDFELGRVAGRVHDRAGENDAAIASYESAKRACGSCGGSQAIIHFEIARVYAKAKRTSEATVNLESFVKMVCKGAAAQRYADECTQAQAMMR